MDTLRLMVTFLALLALTSCKQEPAPYRGQPWVAPDGRVVQPPLEGWPDDTAHPD